MRELYRCGMQGGQAIHCIFGGRHGDGRRNRSTHRGEAQGGRHAPHTSTAVAVELAAFPSVCGLYGTVDDHAEVSPDSKPSSNMTSDTIMLSEKQ